LQVQENNLRSYSFLQDDDPLEMFSTMYQLISSLTEDEGWWRVLFL